MEFRKLTKDEIDVRVGGVYETGITLLLYKNARVDMDILDETVGMFNWQKSYQLIDGQLFCTLEIWDKEKEQWIKKQDVGVESKSEAEKGRASDAQKRAAVAAGIGRALYTAPFIWIDHDKVKFNKDGKVKDRFKVRYIDYKDKAINCLVIENGRGELVFSYGTPQK